jgi:hypothetical protein
MTVAELMERLEQYDGAMEVRLAFQPSWPFEHSVLGVTSREEACGRQVVDLTRYLSWQKIGDAQIIEDYGGRWGVIDQDGEPEAAFDTREEAEREARAGGEDCVFLAEGSQLQYGSKNIWEVAS